DGDGDLDMAVANRLSADDASVLLNTGDGTFGSATGYPSGSSWAYSVALGDLDGDGDLDMAVATAIKNEMNVLLNTGDGTFAPPTGYIVGDGPGRVTLGDLDGDGDLDMAVVNLRSDDISILLNQCTQSCPADLTSDGELNFFDVSAFLVAFLGADTIADLNGDGQFDIFDVIVFLDAYNAGCP
ncbi:MAG: FG-GAP-like repeat-containing protein, partial [bacterium]|nr:FG-GAP-like repeat-containing protein [bacterium]